MGLGWPCTLGTAPPAGGGVLPGEHGLSTADELNTPRALTVVLTGGPQGGKSTLLRRLAGDPHVAPLLTVVPEAASIIWAGGHPLPQASWAPAHWSQLEVAITSLQMSLEEALVGRTPLTICDRAPFDNLAYPQGRQALELLWGPSFMSRLSRYHLVVHLESLATAEPERFGGRLGNEGRFEDLAEAQAQEMRTRQAWEGHPNRHFVSGVQPFEQVLVEATAIIKSHLWPPQQPGRLNG